MIANRFRQPGHLNYKLSELIQFNFRKYKIN